MNVVGLAVAVLAAVGFSVSTSLQHHANTTLRGGRDDVDHLALLVRRPWWVVGQGVALVAFALHAWALRLGLLAVVQPVVVSGVVLAVPVRAALERRLPGLRELATVALTAAGLSLFLVAAHPSVGTGTPGTPGALVVTVVGALAAGAAWRWGHGRAGRERATAFGAASGVLFGLTAGLVKLAVTSAGTATGVTPELWALLTAWQTWLVPVVGISGVALNQWAYRAAPLSVSMPLLNVVDVLVAIAFGVLVFGEVPAHGPWELAGQSLGLALLVSGLGRLARSTVDGVPAPARGSA